MQLKSACSPLMFGRYHSPTLIPQTRSHSFIGLCFAVT
jgi:hypothetical protein